MNIIEIIEKKKNKEILTNEEIEYVIENFLNGNIKDYQMSSLLMAICINGMEKDEIFNLTKAMLDSGDKIDLSEIKGTKVDKHSSGGIGDKTTLVLLPIVASLGVNVAKMSGRGLGFTGGTIDKLESIDGFEVEKSREDFLKQVEEIGIALVSQSGNLVPADKKIYALRDVSGTVESIALIASSIMSKKLASGADAIVLDVKVGKGALMKNVESARKLGKTMKEIGEAFGKKMSIFLTNMEEPLGYAVGNGLEVKEAIDTLKGNGPKDLEYLCFKLASQMVSFGLSIPVEEAEEKVKEVLKNGKAYQKFEEWITYQGGDINKIEISSNYQEIRSSKEGFITNIDALKIGYLVKDLGAGRNKKEDEIDYGVGVVIHKKVGEYIKQGESLLTIYYNKEYKEEDFINCFIISDKQKEKNKLIYEIM